jgi:hypothetical protein
MTPTRLPALGASIFTALTVIACGSGGGGGGGGVPTAGIDRGGITIAQGPITGFGSVIVNGVRYSTTGANILVDGVTATEADLAVGQVVRVEGTVDTGGTTGTARSVRFDDDVTGPIQSIDLASGRLVVLGQPVQTGAATSFDDSIVPRGLEGLAVGDHVEVSGLVAANGVINATRIERSAAAGELEVRGTVSNLDAGVQRFEINELAVDYSAAQLADLQPGGPANGDLVEVHGTLDAAGTLVATRVEGEDRALDGGEDDEADLEGLVTRFASVTDFDVAGQSVTTNAATEFRDGTAADLALGVDVEVEGEFDASGRVVADKIEFRRTADAKVRIAGLVEQVDSSAGTLVVLGLTVRTNAVTRFEDHSDADLERFGIGDLRAGDFVEIRAHDDGGTLIATRVERDEPDDEVELRGRASDLAAPTLRVAGVTIETTSETEFERDDERIDASTFFAEADGRIVKVDGQWDGSTLTADEAEIEENED